MPEQPIRIPRVWLVLIVGALLLLALYGLVTRRP
jgi:hypothetical protein